MKELSIEEKAHRYDEAIKVANKYKDTHIMFSQIKDEIFPELAESEGERIRRVLTDYFKWNPDGQLLNEFSNREVFAWLEKQGEQKPTYRVEPKFKIGDTIKKESTGDIVIISEIDLKNGEYRLSNTGFIPFKYEHLWELVEQKSADKVEPKFHEGDWAVSNLDKKARQISEVHFDEYNSYYVVDGKTVNLEEYDRLHHLWTIQNAKDGDVLAAHECLVLFKEIDGLNIRCYCTYHFMNNTSFYVDTLQNKEAFHPATKEQRDTLMKAMADAGYTFDFDKKELKKIEQKPIECKEKKYSKCYVYNLPHNDEMCEQCEFNPKNKKPAKWSALDETNLQGIIDEIEANKNQAPDYDLATYNRFLSWLESIKDRIQPQIKRNWSKEDEDVINHLLTLCSILSNCAGAKKYRQFAGCSQDDVVEYQTWLKSLKDKIQPQNTWKPSDEQLDALYDAAMYVGKSMFPYPKGILMKLYKQLKKLRKK